MNLKDLKNIAEKNYIDVSSKWFLEKIKDGSLQIKKTPIANHSKFYIFSKQICL